MGKVRAPLCRFRRKNKNQLNSNQNLQKGDVMESEDELNIANENEKYENYTANQSNNGHQTSEAGNFESIFENGINDDEQPPNLVNHHNDGLQSTSNDPESHEHPEQEETHNENMKEETLDNLLDKMNTDNVDLDDIKNLSITVSEQSELSNLQSFVSNKLTEILKKTSIGEKCMDSLAPLCLGSNGNECSPIDKLLGCFAENGSLVNENELQIPEAESFRDPPTLPSGIKFVDDFNKLLDKWTDESNGPENGMTGANVFKLFNLSALLKHLGDPRYVEILNKLKLNNMDRSWEQILNANTPGVSEGALLVKNPLPELPNPKAISNCNAKLVDLPQLDNKNVDEHAFKLYWAYTNTWLNRMFGPSFKNSRFLQPTKNWYMNMERASQLFFLRLSKTLCSA